MMPGAHFETRYRPRYRVSAVGLVRLPFGDGVNRRNPVSKTTPGFMTEF
jgi:hypothetical protein